MRARGVETVANRGGPAADGPHSFFRRSMRAAAALTIARAAIIAISLSAWRPAGGPFARELTTSMETAARDGRYRATTVSGNERTEFEGPRDRGSIAQKRAVGLYIRA